jgi:hypothetical protein
MGCEEMVWFAETAHRMICNDCSTLVVKDTTLGGDDDPIAFQERQYHGVQYQ